jgi:hypothetical protein
MIFTVFRHAAYDSPWWAFPSARSGRFHRGSRDTAQYLCLHPHLCLHPLGPAAEMLRHNVGPDGDPDQLILNLWTAVIEIGDVTRVDFADCEYHGLTADELVGDDYRRTQELAAAVAAGGAAALIVPSAALPGTDNLLLFGPRVLNPFLRPPLSSDEIRTGRLTDAGRSPLEVAPHVRWNGVPHSAVEQWKATGSYDAFDDPPAGRW